MLKTCLSVAEDTDELETQFAGKVILDFRSKSLHLNVT